MPTSLRALIELVPFIVASLAIFNLTLLSAAIRELPFISKLLPMTADTLCPNALMALASFIVRSLPILAVTSLPA